MNVTVVIKAPLKQLKTHTLSSIKPSIFSSIINDNDVWKNFILRDYPLINLNILESFYDCNYLFIYRTLQNYSNLTLNGSTSINELQKIIEEDDVYTFKYFLFINKNFESLIIQKTYKLMTYENFEIYSYLLMNYSITSKPNYEEIFKCIPETNTISNTTLNNIRRAHRKFILQQIKKCTIESDIMKIKQISIIINLYVEKYCEKNDNISIINNILQERIAIMC